MSDADLDCLQKHHIIQGLKSCGQALWLARWDWDSFPTAVLVLFNTPYSYTERIESSWNTVSWPCAWGSAACVWCCASAASSSSQSSWIFVPSCCNSAICPATESGAGCFVAWLPAISVFPGLTPSLTGQFMPKWAQLIWWQEYWRSAEQVQSASRMTLLQTSTDT